MLNAEDQHDLYSFLNRLQKQTVRVEVASRINVGFRQSYSVELEKQGDCFNCTSKSGEVSMFIDPTQAESFSSDHSSVTLVFGDNIITVRYARSR